MSDQIKEQYEKLKEQPLLAWAALIAIPLIMLLLLNLTQDEVEDKPVVIDTVAAVEVAPDITPETKQAVIDAIMSEGNPIIKDATWHDKGKHELYIGVIDDKTNRDGLADYVCQTLNVDFNLKAQVVSVYVMDIAKIAKDNKWVQLGKAKCRPRQDTANRPHF